MRERRKYLVILGVILALLVGAALLAVPGSPVYKKPVLGLDLQGGLEVVLKATPETKSQPITPAGMATAQRIMTSRVNKIGVSSPNVAVQGNDQIVIQLAGVHDPAKAAQIIGTDGRASAVRLRAEPRSADGDRKPAAGPAAVALQPVVGGAEGSGQGHAAGVLPLQDRQEEGHAEGQGQERHEDADLAPAHPGHSSVRRSHPQAAPSPVQGREAAAEHADPEDPGEP